MSQKFHVILLVLWAVLQVQCTRDRKINECKAGETLDPDTKQCKPSTTTTFSGNHCPAGQWRNPEDPTGNECFTDTQMNSYCQRLNGQVHNDNGGCKCDTGKVSHPQSGACVLQQEAKDFCESKQPRQLFQGGLCVPQSPPPCEEDGKVTDPQDPAQCTSLEEAQDYCARQTPAQRYDGQANCVDQAVNCSTEGKVNHPIAGSSQCVTTAEAEEACKDASKVYDATSNSCTESAPSNPKTPPDTARTPASGEQTVPQPESDQVTDSNGKICHKDHVITDNSKNVCCPQTLKAVTEPDTTEFTGTLASCSKATLAEGTKVCITNVPTVKSGTGNAAILEVSFRLLPRSTENENCSYSGEFKVGNFEEVKELQPTIE